MNAHHKLKLDKKFILTVTGSDHPEIITTITEILHRFKGSMEVSRFNRVKDHFSGLFAVSINSMYFNPFIACLESLESTKLRFQFNSTEDSQSSYPFDPENISFNISIWGVKNQATSIELLRILSRNHLRVDSIETNTMANRQGYTLDLNVSTDHVIDVELVERELLALAEREGFSLSMLDEEESIKEAI
ncbi:ACT domain-containing protein [Kangiella sp. M94]